MIENEKEMGFSTWKVLRNINDELVIHQRLEDGEVLEHFNPSHQQNNTQWDDLIDLIEALLFQNTIDMSVSQRLRKQTRALEIAERFD